MLGGPPQGSLQLQYYSSRRRNLLLYESRRSGELQTNEFLFCFPPNLDTKVLATSFHPKLKANELPFSRLWSSQAEKLRVAPPSFSCLRSFLRNLGPGGAPTPLNPLNCYFSNAKESQSFNFLFKSMLSL